MFCAELTHCGLYYVHSLVAIPTIIVMEILIINTLHNSCCIQYNYIYYDIQNKQNKKVLKKITQELLGDGMNAI